MCGALAELVPGGGAYAVGDTGEGGAALTTGRRAVAERADVPVSPERGLALATLLGRKDIDMEVLPEEADFNMPADEA
ncbi:hypothetical protein [Streptomyces mirabilis]|uniref:hypothetical protein n=1 Tax=Streptomyces mirabilis TaxID=68239 RepID=UPI0036B8EE9A